MFSWIKRRWKEANGLNTHPFGGLLVILVILVGDVAQLPPVTDQEEKIRIAFLCTIN